jgi:hypothetical protein
MVERFTKEQLTVLAHIHRHICRYTRKIGVVTPLVEGCKSAF